MSTNKSGIYPAANRVLVKPDPVHEKQEGSLIELPPEVVQKAEQGQASGVLVAAGPDAYRHVTEVVRDTSGAVVERRIRGYSQPFAEIGQRVAFAKYTGLRVRGEDGERYLIINDEDITAKISDQVRFTDLDTRQAAGLQGL